MKLFTKRFIHRKGKYDGKDQTLYNAESAMKKLGIPKELWLELSKKTSRCELIKYIGLDVRTALMAGFAIGWAEKNDKIK